MQLTAIPSHRRRRNPPDAHVLQPLPLPCATAGEVSSFPRTFPTDRVSAEDNGRLQTIGVVKPPHPEGEDEAEILMASSSVAPHAKRAANFVSYSPCSTATSRSLCRRSSSKEEVEQPCVPPSHLERGHSTPKVWKWDAEGRGRGVRRGPSCVVRSALAARTRTEPHFLPRQEAGKRVSPAAHRMPHASRALPPHSPPASRALSAIAVDRPSGSGPPTVSGAAPAPPHPHALPLHPLRPKEVPSASLEPNAHAPRGGGGQPGGAGPTVPDQCGGGRVGVGGFPARSLDDAPLPTAGPIHGGTSQADAPHAGTRGDSALEEACQRLTQVIDSSASPSCFVDPLLPSWSTMGKARWWTTTPPVDEEEEEKKSVEAKYDTNGGQGGVERRVRWSAGGAKDDGVGPSAAAPPPKREEGLSVSPWKRSDVVHGNGTPVPPATVSSSPLCFPFAGMPFPGWCGEERGGSAAAGSPPHRLCAAYPLLLLPADASLFYSFCHTRGWVEKRGAVAIHDHDRCCPYCPRLGRSGNAEEEGGGGDGCRLASEQRDRVAAWQYGGGTTACGSHGGGNDDLPTGASPHTRGERRRCACGGVADGRHHAVQTADFMDGAVGTRVSASPVTQAGTPPCRRCTGWEGEEAEEIQGNGGRGRTTHDTKDEKKTAADTREGGWGPLSPEGGRTRDVASSCGTEVPNVAVADTANGGSSASTTDEVAISCVHSKDATSCPTRFPNPMPLPPSPPSVSPSPLPPSSLATSMGLFPYSCASLIESIYGGATPTTRKDGGNPATTMPPPLDSYGSFAAWKDRATLEKEKDGGFFSCARSLSSKTYVDDSFPLYPCAATPEKLVDQTLARLQQAHTRLLRQFSYGVS